MAVRGENAELMEEKHALQVRGAGGTATGCCDGKTGVGAGWRPDHVVTRARTPKFHPLVALIQSYWYPRLHHAADSLKKFTGLGRM